MPAPDPLTALPLVECGVPAPLLATVDYVLLVGLALAGTMLAIGVVGMWLNRRRSADHNSLHLDTIELPRPTLSPAPESESVGFAQISSAIHHWLDELHDAQDVWGTLDLLVRQVLAQQFDAARVRCYRVQPGNDALEPLTSSKNNLATDSSARTGVIGHVATTGREYLADDPNHGDLVHDLAARNDESWAWVWPVTGDTGPIGVIAVGECDCPDRFNASRRAAVGQVLNLCWRHAAAVEQLQLVSRTDHASGVLTRHEFFGVADRALQDSYAANEPVVVAVLALEGLRGLDDGGRWRERDELVEQVGRLIAGRLRSDDLVGRFADDRFVVLLRRLDSGLGRLIAEKMLIAINERIGELGELRNLVRLRLGLAGSGLRQPVLEQLLEIAFEAVERARADNVSIQCDLTAARPPGGQP